MIQLESAQLNAPAAKDGAKFPFTVPAIAALLGHKLEFPTAVTFFIGENGSGKSTLLEALASAIGSITVGSRPAEDDSTLGHIRPLAKAMRLSWVRRTKRGFFMRSEDFFGYAQSQQRLREELEAERREFEEDPTLSPYAKGLAMGPLRGQIGDMQRRYGDGLDSASHGESFLKLFQNRFVPDGLYLLDEPEAPLSPMRQLALIALIKECVEQKGAQFIIATHSPIVMAAPHATIYSFDEHGAQRVAYEDTEHVRLTRDFLNHPDSFLQHL